MKKIFFRTLLFFCVGILIIFSVITLIVADNMNRSSAKDNAANLLGVFEKQMIDGQYGSLAHDDPLKDYKTLATITGEAKNIRITVIATDGTIFADTDFDDPSVMANHSDRKEFKAALKGEIGTDIRNSEMLKIKFLYMAKIVAIDGAEVVVLRIAVPVKAIDAYLYTTLFVTAIIFIAALIAAIIISRYAAERINKPFVLIKEKLGDVLNPSVEPKPIVLTKHDDINVMLQDIDGISGKLNTALSGYQSEKHKLEIILGNIDQAILAIDNQKNIIVCNKMAEEYFCFEFFEPVFIEKVIRNKAILDNINQALAKNEFISYDHVRLDGQTFEVRFFPVSFKEISLIITSQNVTDIRKTSREKQEFFVNASHELNTPLSGILGYAEILKKEKKYKAEFIDIIYKQATRMKSLIGDMLTLSEVEEGKELPEEMIDLKEIAADVLSAYIPKAENKNIKLVADTESVLMKVNKEKITEVISNLVDNSIKYTDSGEVALTIKKENGIVIISVKDTGIGIEQKHLSRICERFYRTDKGRSKAEGGTGLGLAIVKHICNHYGAVLKINSKENFGTEVIISFQRKE